MRILALLAIALVVAGCAGPANPGTSSSPKTTSAAPDTSTTLPPVDGSIHLFYDFGGEKAGPGDLTGWKSAAEIADDGTSPPIPWNVTACDATGWEDHVHIKAHPVHSACYSVGGRPGAGALWISRSFPAVKGTSYQVNMTVHALAENPTGPIGEVLMRVGDSPAASSAQFGSPDDAHQASLRRPMDTSAGWKTFNVTWAPGPLQADNLVVEIGVFVIWRDQVTRYLDALTVDLTPVQA